MKYLMKPSKITVILLTVSALLILLCLPVSAGEVGRIYDPAELLTSEEEASLEARLNDWSDTYEVQLFMATYTAEGYYDDFIGDEYCGQIRNLRGEDAVLLIVTYDLSDRRYYYDMYTYGDANYAISQKEVDFILDHGDVYPNIKGGNVADGAEAFFALSAEAFEGRVGVSWAIIIAVSALIALLIALVVCAGVIASYKKKKASVDYPLDRYAKLELSKNRDTFIREYTTRTYSPKSSGSGGGGGSSHGGGGGHRGGR